MINEGKINLYRVLGPTCIQISDLDTKIEIYLDGGGDTPVTNTDATWVYNVMLHDIDARYLKYDNDFNSDNNDISKIKLYDKELNLDHVRIGRINGSSLDFVEHDTSDLNNLMTVIEYAGTPPTNITSRPYFKGFVIKDENVGIVSRDSDFLNCVETEPLDESFIENGSNAIPVKQDSTGDVYVDLNCDFVKCNTLRIGNFKLESTNGEIQITEDSGGTRLMGNVDFLEGNIDYSVINNSEIF